MHNLWKVDYRTPVLQLARLRSHKQKETDMNRERWLQKRFKQ